MSPAARSARCSSRLTRRCARARRAALKTENLDPKSSDIGMQRSVFIAFDPALREGKGGKQARKVDNLDPKPREIRAQCSVFIAFDPALREGKGGEQARARNSDIVEDLGLVEYVFSDKTGTLTSNEMQLRAVAVKDTAFGGLDTRWAPWSGFLQNPGRESALWNLAKLALHAQHQHQCSILV